MSSPSALLLNKLPYTIQNLPYGIISTSKDPKRRCAVAIGVHAIDLVKYVKEGALFEIERADNAVLQQIFAEVCFPGIDCPGPLSGATAIAVEPQWP